MEEQTKVQTQIDWDIYKELLKYGIIGDENRKYNVGSSDYSEHLVQPWSIWQMYNLDPWDADIVKRVLRHKRGERKSLDYEKIIQICEEKIRQLREIENNESNNYKADIVD